MKDWGGTRDEATMDQCMGPPSDHKGGQMMKDKKHDLDKYLQ